METCNTVQHNTLTLMGRVALGLEWPSKQRLQGKGLYVNESILSKDRVRGAFCCLALSAAPTMSQNVSGPPLCNHRRGGH